MVFLKVHRKTFHFGHYLILLLRTNFQESEAARTNDTWCLSTVKRLKEVSPLSLKVSLRSVSLSLSVYIVSFFFDEKRLHRAYGLTNCSNNGFRYKKVDSRLLISAWSVNTECHCRGYLSRFRVTF